MQIVETVAPEQESSNPVFHKVGENLYRHVPSEITMLYSNGEASSFAVVSRLPHGFFILSAEAVLAYDAADLDRDVVAPDQIRTVLATFRDKVFTEMFRGRTDLPKTLIFAKDDTHADDIVRICREVFSTGNDFCQKVTYRTGFVRVVEKKHQADGKEAEEIT